jgi:hypothetical protein
LLESRLVSGAFDPALYLSDSPEHLMSARLAGTTLLFALVLAFRPAASAQPAGAEAPIIDLPGGKSTWDLRALDADPIKLVKADASPDGKVVRFILEFQRDLTVRDTDWRGPAPRPPFWFRFQDADGTTIHSEIAEYGSELVGLQGRRVRIVLLMPPAWARTKKVIVDPRPYGES